MRKNPQPHKLTAAILGILSLPLAASPSGILVDFGADTETTGTDANGKVWNNVSGGRITTVNPTPSLVGAPLISSLVDSTGAATGISMAAQLVAPSGQLKIGGTAVDADGGVGTSPTGTVHVESAANDSLYVNSKNDPENNYYEVVLGGLSAGVPYDFHFLCAAEGGADNGNASFAVIGAEMQTGTIPNNVMVVAPADDDLDQNFLSFLGVVPDVDNQITIRFTSTVSAANSNGRWNTMEFLESSDSDGDGLPDAYEWTIIEADPDDAVSDLSHVAGPNDLPDITDFDNDGASDAAEYTNGTEPLNPDSDGDGLPDGVETDTGTFVDANDAGTDPLVADSDGDGLDDGREVVLGSVPTDGASLPGTAVAITNGGFEEPLVAVSGEGIPVSGGTVPGWTVNVNDAYVTDVFGIVTSSEGSQFLATDRTSPNPDAAAESFTGGADAEMGVRQDIDVTALAADIDAGARTLLVAFDWWDADPADIGRVSVQFLDGSANDLGRPASRRLTGEFPGWRAGVLPVYPPAGTRTVRLTLAGLNETDAGGNGAGTERNVRYDNVRVSLAYADADNDQMPDDWELANGLNPSSDSDADGDPDGDGLTNLEEFNLGTDPTMADSDGDGATDGAEVANGTDPLDPADFPLDSDNDGLPDAYEYTIIDADANDAVSDLSHVAGPNDLPLTTDFDDDALSDAQEYSKFTDPLDPDTDGDGLLDGVETLTFVYNGPGDTGTDPLDPDSDFDGFLDGFEVIYGSEPNDESSIPGTELPVVNGGFEEPSVELNPTVGVPVSGGAVPGWKVVQNDAWVVEIPVENVRSSEGFQFLSTDRREPEPDVDVTELDGGDDAVMAVYQDVDVSGQAGEIDAGARTMLVSFDWFDGDSQDIGEVSVRFLDAAANDLGRQRSVRTTNGRSEWLTTRLPVYPPPGTRTVQVTLAALNERDNGENGNGTVRNVNWDNVSLRLVHIDADSDGMADDWELANGLNPESDSDAGISSDADTLTNLQEFEAGTDPFLADTDGDGFNDDVEIAAGSDPLDAEDFPSPPASTPVVLAVGFNPEGEFEVTYDDLDTNTTYRLMRGTDLLVFPDEVDRQQPATATDLFTDPNPPAGKAFYRLESGQP